jgi:hypothetical protein
MSCTQADLQTMFVQTVGWFNDPAQRPKVAGNMAETITVQCVRPSGPTISGKPAVIAWMNNISHYFNFTVIGTPNYSIQGADAYITGEGTGIDPTGPPPEELGFKFTCLCVSGQWLFTDLTIIGAS